MPLWAVYAVSFGTPIAAFLGVLIGTLVTRKADTELEVRSRREEVMRTLRWAAELAISRDPGRARLGLSQLEALGDSDLLDDSQQLFIDAALAAVTRAPQEELRALGPGVEVIEVDPADMMDSEERGA